MMMDKFLSIKEKSEGSYKEKGSKFIALAFPVSDEADIKEIINSVKKMDQYYSKNAVELSYYLGQEEK